MYVVDADLKSYFDTIPHERLLNRLRERIADTRLLGLIETFLKAGIMDGLHEWEPEAGAPQGAVLSPLLSNIYLNPLDHQMAAQGYQMIRYADDFVILCRSQAEAEQALALIRQWCADESLQLHPTKTKIVDVRDAGFDFLGYHFQTTRRGRLAQWPRKKSMQKLKDTIRAKTTRTNGHSLAYTYSRREPDVAWLVRLLQTQLSDDVHGSGRLGSYAVAQYSAQACGPAWSRSWTGSSTLAELVLCQAWVFLPGSCPCRGESTPSGVRPLTGEPDAGNPPVRFGGRGDRNQSVFPTPIPSCMLL